MSQRREQLAERLPALGAVLDRIEAWYHVPLLVVLAGFMLWIRVRNWRNFLVGGRVYFSGNDPWYHLRQVRYTVRHWPWTMPFDPWTSFPTGTSVGQFGTLYDQLVATAALLIGLGSPTDQTTALALLFAPAVLGTLAVIPTYFLGKRLGGRFGGVVGVAVLALSPGTFLSRSVAGFSDHHVAEALFQALAVAVIVVALAAAEREKPVYEQFRERDYANLRRPVGWAALAGVAIALYIWVWPPGLFLVGIFGVFLLIALPAIYLRGESPEHVAIVGAVALGVAGVLMLATFNTTAVGVTDFSLLHPALALVGALGCVFLAWLARTIEARDLPALTYPGVVFGLFVLGALVMWVALPTLFEFFLGQLDRIVAFKTSNTGLTVAEVQPPYRTGPSYSFGDQATQALAFFYNSYDLAYVTAAVGALFMLGRLVLGRTKEWAVAAFVLVWTAFMVSATLTQARFDYYLLVPVAVMNAYFVGQVLRFVGSSGTRVRLRNVEPFQVLVVVAVVFLITAPLATGSAGTLTAAGATANSNSAPGSTVQGWDGSLQWLGNNTPSEGTYGGNPANSMGYYERFPRTDDFDYPDGAYGVLSWWDYGHWITVLGHRIPTANPFQQNAHQSANFLLADNASHANDIVRMRDGEGVRYVMIDWKMADPAGGGLFSAPFSWYDDGPLSYYDDVTPIVTQQSDGSVGTVFNAYEQRHYETMRTRLYSFHGSEIEPEPVVVDYDQPVPLSSGSDSLRAAFYPTANNSTAVKRFDNMSAARAYVEQDGSAQLGGVGRYPAERVPALEHYRLVHASRGNPLISPSGGRGQLFRTAYQRLRATGLNATGLFATPTNWVKTFERVSGARVAGRGPPNTTVEATVEMRMPSTNDTTFNYTQQARTNAQGRFTMTLPYSTTGYDQWGTEKGATDVSVRATGPYTFRTPVEGSGGNATRWNATAAVPEGAVIGRTSGTIGVELQRESVSLPANGTATNATGTNATSTNATAPTNAPTASGNATANGSAGNATANASGPNTTATATATATATTGGTTTGEANATTAAGSESTTGGTTTTPTTSGPTTPTTGGTNATASAMVARDGSGIAPARARARR